MRRTLAVLVAALLAIVPLPTADARRDPGPPAAVVSPYELVVFEADGCVYCDAFRADVLPLYKASQIGREIPIRFVSVSRSDETRMGLGGGITVVPTFVLMAEGREIDRIVGYPGPFNFMKLVAYMLGRSE